MKYSVYIKDFTTKIVENHYHIENINLEEYFNDLYERLKDPNKGILFERTSMCDIGKKYNRIIMYLDNTVLNISIVPFFETFPMIFKYIIIIGERGSKDKTIEEDIFCYNLGQLYDAYTIYENKKNEFIQKHDLLVDTGRSFTIQERFSENVFYRNSTHTSKLEAYFEVFSSNEYMEQNL